MSEERIPIERSPRVSINRGEYRRQWFRISERTAAGLLGAPRDLSTATDVLWIAKLDLVDLDVNAKITKRMSTGGIELWDQTTLPGELVVVIDGADTADLLASRYWHQLWEIDVYGNARPAFDPQVLIIVQPVRLG